MASDALVFDSIAQSNIPAREKSSIRRWYERLSGHNVITRAKTHVVQGGQVLRQGGESLVVGGILGALHAELPNGLDVEVHGREVPIDGLGGAAAMAASVMLAHEPIACELANAGAAGLTIFAFRKVNQFQAEKKLAGAKKTGGAPKATMAGERHDAYGATRYGDWTGTTSPHRDERSYDVGADPIVQAARALGK